MKYQFGGVVEIEPKAGFRSSFKIISEVESEEVERSRKLALKSKHRKELDRKKYMKNAAAKTLSKQLGLCANGQKHGRATHGHLCASCRELAWESARAKRSKPK